MIHQAAKECGRVVYLDSSEEITLYIELPSLNLIHATKMAFCVKNTTTRTCLIPLAEF